MAHSPSRGRLPFARDSRVRNPLAGVAILFAVATVVGLIALWPSGERSNIPSELGFARDVFEAEIVEMDEVPCPGTLPEDAIRCDRITLELQQGPDTGSFQVLDLPKGESRGGFEVREEIVLTYTPSADEGFQYQFADRQRRAPLLWLALMFAVAVVALGRLRGAAALAGLAVSFVVLLQFVLPAIVEGRSPLLVALVGASAIAFLALYLAHGFTLKTTVALLGTLGSLALTAILASLFVEVTKLTGFSSEEAVFVSVGGANIDLAGLVLGGVVIGALGAIDDMTVTQASAVWELRGANPTMRVGELLRSSLRIGRDHVASTVNTLFLAYAGASLPLLILFVFSQQSLGTVANSEVVATEILRTLVGSVGLVASVPLTTWLAVRTAPRPESGGGGSQRPPEPDERPDF